MELIGWSEFKENSFFVFLFISLYSFRHEASIFLLIVLFTFVGYIDLVKILNNWKIDKKKNTIRAFSTIVFLSFGQSSENATEFTIVYLVGYIGHIRRSDNIPSTFVASFDDGLLSPELTKSHSVNVFLFVRTLISKNTSYQILFEFKVHPMREKKGKRKMTVGIH